MDLDSILLISIKNLPQCLNIIGSVRSSSKIWQVELNLIPAFIESHRHSANKRFDSGCALIVGCAESAPHILVVEHLHLKCEILLQVFYNHNKEGELDSKGLIGICRASDEVSCHVSSHDFDYGALNIWIGEPFNMSISNKFLPNLQWLASIQSYRQELLTLCCKGLRETLIGTYSWTFLILIYSSIIYV